MRSLFSRDKPSEFTGQPVHAEVPQLGDAELAAIYYGKRMAGDFYEFLRVSPNRVLFALLDMAGRVDDNRKVVSATQKTFRDEAPALFAKEYLNEADAMVELCLHLNRTIIKAEGGVRSCAAFAGCYNEGLGTVCYVNAGHTPGLLRHGTGVTELPATGLPLGLFSHATCDAPIVAIEPSAALLLVSRGLVESKHKGKEFGLERSKHCLQNGYGSSAKDLCIGLLESMQQFIKSTPADNDVTALALLRCATGK